MVYPLSVNWIVGIDRKERFLRSGVVSMSLATELGEYARSGFPDSITGKLLGISPGKILHLASAPGVEAGFRGGRYRLRQLDIDGTCHLCRNR